MKSKLHATLSHQLPQLMRQFVLCTSYGSRTSNTSRRIHDHAAQSNNQLVKAFKCLANAFRNSVLRNRTHGNCFKPVRPSTFWRRSISLQPSTSRLADSGRASYNENDARASKNLFANDRAQVGYLDGSMRFYRRDIRYIRSCARNRSIPSSRCVCSWLPTATRNVNRRGYGDSTNYRSRQHTVRRRWCSSAIATRYCYPVFAKCRFDNQRFVTAQTSTQSATNYTGGL